MKLSNETLTILKNFSTINSGIYFKQGSKLVTVSPSKTILAEVSLEEEFPQDFGIYDLNQFLSVLNLYSDASLDFDSVNVTFSSGRKSTKYRLTDKSQIVVPPEKQLTLPSKDVEFFLSDEDLAWLLKTASVLQSPNVSVESDGEKMTITTFDASNDAASTNSVEITEKNDNKFKMVFKTENLKLIPGGYDVKISKKGISQFKNTKKDLQYWIAIEASSSKFEG